MDAGAGLFYNSPYSLPRRYSRIAVGQVSTGHPRYVHETHKVGLYNNTSKYDTRVIGDDQDYLVVSCGCLEGSVTKRSTTKGVMYA